MQFKGQLLNTTNINTSIKSHVSKSFRIRHHIITAVNSIMGLQNNFAESFLDADTSRDKQALVHHCLQLQNNSHLLFVSKGAALSSTHTASWIFELNKIVLICYIGVLASDWPFSDHEISIFNTVSTLLHHEPRYRQRLHNVLWSIPCLQAIRIISQIDFSFKRHTSRCHSVSDARNSWVTLTRRLSSNLRQTNKNNSILEGIILRCDGEPVSVGKSSETSFDPSIEYPLLRHHIRHISSCSHMLCAESRLKSGLRSWLEGGG